MGLARFVQTNWKFVLKMVGKMSAKIFWRMHVLLVVKIWQSFTSWPFRGSHWLKPRGPIFLAPQKRPKGVFFCHFFRGAGWVLGYLEGMGLGFAHNNLAKRGVKFRPEVRISFTFEFGRTWA